jgi:hypothetical protein
MDVVSGAADVELSEARHLACGQPGHAERQDN